MQTQLRKYFNSRATLNPKHRIEILKALKNGIISNLQPLYDALWRDLHKSEQESYLTEVALVIDEINYHIKHLRKWSKPQNISSPITLFPSKSKIIAQPYGVVLIIAPWNYPFQLLFSPLVAAISAGNCVLLKPSHLAIHTAEICTKIITDTLINIPDKDSAVPLKIITGDPHVMDDILQEEYDYIFYTGGPVFGKTIASIAAKTLTPVTLELGGKSPCIITEQANLKVAAKRIAWGKFLNCGQTCVAPDYILVESTIKDNFIKHIISYIIELYGIDSNAIIANNFYGRIINQLSFNRLKTIIDLSIQSKTIIHGGKTDSKTLFIEPTLINAGIIDNTSNTETNPAMQEEIFGPILPIIEYTNLEEAIKYIHNRPKPLALYIFGNKAQADKTLKETFSAGACINDTIMHVANRNLPFGGVGLSGMGNYHGKYGFDTFSHKKSYVVSPRNFDLPVKYPPYKWFWIIKRCF